MVRVEDILIWSEDRGQDWVHYLIEPEEVIDRASFVDYDGFHFAIEGLPSNINPSKLEDLIKDAIDIENIEIEDEIEKIEEVLNEHFSYEDIIVYQLEDYPQFNKDIIVFDKYNKAFYELTDEYFDIAKIYEYHDGSNSKRLVYDPNFNIGYETELTVTEGYVDLDEWDGRNFSTNGVGYHQYVKPILNKDGSVVHEYLVVEWSQWQGELTTVDIMNRYELKEHLEELGRDVNKYMKEIDDLKDREIIEVLRRDNDFAEDMDELGLNPENTAVTFVYATDEERFNFEKDVKVHELFHESTSQHVLLIDKSELALERYVSDKQNSNEYELG